MWAIGMMVTLGLGMGGLFVMAATVQRLLSFRAEVRRMRLASEVEVSPFVVRASARDGMADLREADMLLSTAEGEFSHGLRRLKWSLVGLGDPARREAQLAAACRELLEANGAVKQAALKLDHFDADGVDEVPLFHDPVRELAAQGRWLPFAILSLTPRFVRGVFSYRRVRAQLVPLLEATRELQSQVRSFRKTHEPAPPRRQSLRHRVDTARPLHLSRPVAA